MDKRRAQIPRRTREEIGRIVRRKLKAARVPIQTDTPIYIAIGVLSPNGRAWSGASIFNTEPFHAMCAAIGNVNLAREWLERRQRT